MFYYHYPIIGREIRLPIYLVSIGMHDCQPLIRRGTEYACPQLFYTTKGRASGYLYELLIEFDRAIGHIGASAPADPAVIKCVNLIDRNYCCKSARKICLFLDFP